MGRVHGAEYWDMAEVGHWLTDAVQTQSPRQRCTEEEAYGAGLQEGWQEEIEKLKDAGWRDVRVIPRTIGRAYALALIWIWEKLPEAFCVKGIYGYITVYCPFPSDLDVCRNDACPRLPKTTRLHLPYPTRNANQSYAKRATYWAFSAGVSATFLPFCISVPGGIFKDPKTRPQTPTTPAPPTA